jgi:photosystem II stability/assembly factor-like uncharacterized protein
MTSDFPTPYARAEVAGLTTNDGGVWLATSVGLYSCRTREFIPQWRGKAIRAIAAARQGGLLLAVADGDTRTAVVLCDPSGTPARTFPPYLSKELKALAESDQGLIIGGKAGIFRLEGEKYTRIYSTGNVIKLEAKSGRIAAVLKGQGPDDRPALAVSDDNGASWRLEWEGEYADQVQAVRGERAITRWRHLVREGEAGTYKNIPAQAAHLGEDGLEAILAGPKLTISGTGRAKVKIKHPSFVDAESLAWDGANVILAGRPGAWSVEPATGSVTDLFADDPLSTNTGRIKQVFHLRDRRFLVTTTSATFLTTDGGGSWRQIISDWGNHHAKALVRDNERGFYLVCKGGLHRSTDDGVSWEWVPVLPRDRHFGELTGMVIAGGRPVLSSKRGVLVPTRDPGIWDWLGTLKGQKVKSLHCDEGGRIISSLFDKKEIHAIDPGTGAAERLAILPEEVEWVGEVQGELLALTKASLFKIAAEGSTPLALPATQSGWHGVSCLQGVLLWKENAAWVGDGASSEWHPIEGWPFKAKKVAVSDDGGLAMLTDGNRLVTVKLPVTAAARLK